MRLLTILIFLTFTTSVSAATISQTKSYDAMNAVNTGGPATNTAEQTFAFDAFDQTLGTLEKVELIYAFDNSFSGELRCIGRWPCSLRSTLTQVINLDGTTDIATKANSVSNGLLGFDRQRVNFNIASPDAAFSGSTMLNVSDILRDPSDDVLISAIARGNVVNTGIPLASYASDTKSLLTGEITLVYTYSETVAPVPLPASALFLVAGLGGMVLIRRKSC